MADNFLQFSTLLTNLNEKERTWCQSHLALFGSQAPREGDAGYNEFTELAGLYNFEDEEDTLGFDWESGS